MQCSHLLGGHGRHYSWIDKFHLVAYSNTCTYMVSISKKDQHLIFAARKP